MSITRLAILGAGSVRCSPGTIAAMASYFGERPLEVCLFDADAERLDLFDRLARTCFAVMESTHSLWATPRLEDALAGVNGVIFQVGLNCARKFRRREEPEDEAMRATLLELTQSLPEGAEVLSLQIRPDELPLKDYRHLPGGKVLSSHERLVRAHQVLRWVKGEDAMFELLKEHERSPIKSWLNDPRTAPRAPLDAGS